MKNLFCLFIICIINIALIAQNQEGSTVNNTVLSSNTHFQTNDRSSLNGKEIIDHYTGNLLLKYVTPVKVPSELSDDFTIVYNANISHNIHKITTFTPQTDLRVGNNVNQPCWVLGFKGIALQTFNFEVLYGQEGQSGEDAPLLIPGYHYTNKIAYYNAFQETEFIQILMADGSIKILQNAIPGGSLTGTFVELGINNKGFAIVEQQSPTNILRNIYYKPGDGLTYLFQEEKITYYGARWPDDGAYGIKTMYLKKIYNSNDNDGSCLEFIYEDNLTNHMERVYQSTGVPYGRKILKKIRSNRVKPNSSESKDVITIEYSEDQIGTNYFLETCSISNQTIDDNLLLSFDMAAASKSLLGNGGFTCEEERTRNLAVISIKNKMDEYDNIEYYPLGLNSISSRKYQRAEYPPISVELYHNYLIKEINYFNGKKSVFEYWDKFFDGISIPNYVLRLDDVNNLQQCDENIEMAFRDCYSNFMIKSRENYNKFGTITVLTSSETYDYSRSGTEDIASSNVNNIFTKIKLINELDITDETDKSVEIVKNYTRRRSVEYDMNTRVRIPLIMLMSDSTIELNLNEKTKSNFNQVVNSYKYDFGVLHTSTYGEKEYYYDGTFRMIKKTVKNYNTTSSDPINSIETNYAVIGESILSFTGGLFNKKIVLTSQETDPNQVITEKTYTSYLPSSPVSSVPISFYYDISKPSYEKVYKGAIVKSYKKNDYYNHEFNAEFKGKLKRITENVTRPSYIDFYYYTSNENNFYRGFLKYSEDDKGLKTEYYYPEISGNSFSSSVNGVVLKFDGTAQQQTFQHSIFQVQPFKTITKLNGIELYTNYTSYNAKGLLAFAIDKDGYYSRYHYDDLGRVTSVCLPGSFTDFAVTPASHGSVQYLYTDNGKTITETTRMDNDPTSLKSVVNKKEYDSFGQLRKISSKNDADNFETKSTFNYNFAGKLSYEEDGSSHKKWFKYDYLSRLIETRFVQNTTTLHTTIDYTLQQNPTTYYQYVTYTDEIGKTEKKYFSNVGNLVKEEKIDGTTLTTLYSYDPVYNLLNVTFPKGDITNYQYDEHNNINLQTIPEQGTKNFKYDKYGNLRFESYAIHSQLVTFNKYDKLNRIILTGFYTVTEDDPALLNPDFDYSTSDGIFDHFENYNTDIANFVLVNMYDSYTPTGVFSGITPPGFPSAGKNLIGKLVMTAFRDKITDPWNYKAYTYDHLGRVVSSWLKYGSSAWFQINTGYDNTGNVITQDVTSSFYWWYNYDKQGRLTNVKTNDTNNPATAKNDASFTYYLNNQPDITTFNTLSRENQYKVYYDNRGRVDNILGQFGDIQWKGMGSGWNTIFQEDLSYYNNNNIGNIVLTNIGSGSWPALYFNYTYGHDRLLLATCTSNNFLSQSFSYDPNGNITLINGFECSSQFLYGDPSKKNRLTSLIKSCNSEPIEYYFLYDHKGNMTSDGLALLYPTDFNRFNLMTKVINSISRSVDYRYDETGNRIYKGGFNTNPELYLIDHTGKQLAVLDGLNNYRIKMANIYGNGLIGKVNVTYNAQNVRTDARQYYFKDHLGSIRVIFDEASSIVCAQDYYPYGEIMRSYVTGSNINDKYKFTEKERDPETNYDYFGARYYSSKLGRFLSVDPMAPFNPGLSPYCYADNNPVNLIDLLGFDAARPKPAPKPLWADDAFKDYWDFKSYSKNNMSDDLAQNKSATPTFRVKTFDSEEYEDDLWRQAGAGWSYGAGINVYEYDAIMNGKSYYNQDDIRRVNNDVFTTLLIATPLKIPFSNIAKAALGTKIAYQLFRGGAFINGGSTMMRQWVRIGFGKKEGEWVFRAAGRAVQWLFGKDHIIDFPMKVPVHQSLNKFGL